MDIYELICNVAFPIVISIILIKQLEEERKDHKSEVNNLSKVIENNTIAITKLLDKEDNND